MSEHSFCSLWVCQWSSLSQNQILHLCPTPSCTVHAQSTPWIPAGCTHRPHGQDQVPGPQAFDVTAGSAPAASSVLFSWPHCLLHQRTGSAVQNPDLYIILFDHFVDIGSRQDFSQSEQAENTLGGQAASLSQLCGLMNGPRRVSNYARGSVGQSSCRVPQVPREEPGCFVKPGLCSWGFSIATMYTRCGRGASRLPGRIGWKELEGFL